MNSEKENLSVILQDSGDDFSNISIDKTGESALEVGQWYWVQHESGFGAESSVEKVIDGKKHKLMCVFNICSNAVDLKEPEGRSGHYRLRLHFNEIDGTLIFEPNHEQVIQAFVDSKQQNVRGLIGQLASCAKKYGLKVTSSNLSYADPLSLANLTPSESEHTGLAVISDVLDVEAFKNEMIEFKNVQLPKIQGTIQKECETMSKWALASVVLPSAIMASMKKDMEKLDDRIDDVSIYAGIDEQAVLVRDGSPASIDERIHLMQRKLFMDEECLFDYDAGGMSFRSIHEFDNWMLRNGNAERLLPFQKSVVAFQVRRHEKEYESSIHPFVKFSFIKKDKKTYLYIRNGEKIYRIASTLSFDDMLFPSDDAMLNEPIMVLYKWGRVERTKTVREYEDILEKAEGKGSGYFSDLKEYKPFNSDNIYFDEISEHFKSAMNKYNKVSLILQGILDRSEALSPHHSISLFKPSDFMNHLKLIYDAEYVLYAGEKPNFEAYRSKLNALANSSSVFVGQFEKFVERETEKENLRRESSEYGRELSEVSRYIPSYNRGPLKVSEASKVMSTGKAIFTWMRYSAKSNEFSRDPKMVKDSITVPFESLLNISAYRAGDYKRFFSDPRTRSEYLKWAPYLLMAEDYVNGKAEVGKPV
ncbi:hypothetical protein JE959_001662 [Aeromonas veronii]|nr:hypothetical protein [Aeromonas veronii]